MIFFQGWTPFFFLFFFFALSIEFNFSRVTNYSSWRDLEELIKRCAFGTLLWKLGVYFCGRIDKKMSFQSITQGLPRRDLQSYYTSAYRLIMLNICLYSSSMSIFINDCLEPSFNPEQPLCLWSLWGMVAGLGYKSQKKWKRSFGALKAKGLSWGCEFCLGSFVL